MIFKRNIALVLLCVTHSCVTQETIDPIQLYFEDVQEQLEVGSFKEGFRRGLHLYGPDTQAKTEIINDLANQSKCTLITINVAELIEGNTSQSLRSLFQQAQKTAGGVILCIDELQILTKSKKYRNYLDELWAECATCFEWYPHIFIVITCTDCRYIDRAFKKQFTCISYPTVPALTMPSKEPAVIQEPVVPPVVQTVPQESPLEKKEVPSVTLSRRQPVTVAKPTTKWNIVKEIAAAGAITGLFYFHNKEQETRTDNLKNQLLEQKILLKNIEKNLPPPIKKSLMEKLHPYLPQILTTVGLLVNINNPYNTDLTASSLTNFFHDHILREDLYTTMKKEGIQVRVAPDSSRPPFNKGQHIFIGAAWNDRMIGKAWKIHLEKIRKEPQELQRQNEELQIQNEELQRQNVNLYDQCEKLRAQARKKREEKQAQSSSPEASPAQDSPLSNTDEVIDSREKNLLNFITAKHVAHITDNNEERILVTDIAIILSVPCLLHVYNIVAQKVFNAALSTLETHKISQKIVQTIQSVHNSIVKNPLTQIFITYALRASYKRYIEIKAHEKALNTFGISLDKINEINTERINEINTFLEDLANKRKTETKSLIGQLRTVIESIPFCSPHVDQIPLSTSQEVELTTFPSNDAT